MSVPLLFLHGWAMNGAMFGDVAVRLGPDFDCHVPDLPGHGAQEKDEPSLARCVEVVGDIIDRLDRPILIGWSMGAAVAWQYLSLHGTQGLGGLVTVDMSPCLLPDEEWTFGLGGQSADAVLSTSSKIEFQWRSMVNNIQRNMYAPGRALASDDDAMKALLLKQNPTTLRPIWDDLVAMDARNTIAGIDIPYLVCAGGQSQLYDPGVAHWIARHAPMAEVQIFPHSGHSPHLEEPEAFCDAIRRFVMAQKSGTTEQKKTMTR
ncbi:alpha/beta fold hydrolase [Falsiruegeria mediterranea]|jgi:pimeloyl-[acyl-carrier protein] methyl ester esterase|uniref:AB hydrolase superfamily protein YdjP n=1 Tax=Falsiruegeria mediterranea M17 TaxID=1200281 RepID=A0A2R8CDH1_9RHOB|nr:alpha/beta fold hydrolase [Falsiruegeria mediterranea]SPJ30485.1 AB hydrolase superfamily protein YdjP [Falsiruegeria mediterranea M17]